MKFASFIPLLNTCCLLGMALVHVGCTRPDATWKPMANLPISNGGFAVGEIEAGIIIVGGTTWAGDAKKWLSEVWIYDPDSNHWTRKADLPWPLAYPAFATIEKQLFVIGGADDRQTFDWLFHFPSGEVVAKLPAPRVHASAVAAGQHLYLAGGTTDANDLKQLTHSFLRIDTASGEMAELPPVPGKPRMLMASAMAQDTVFLFGGCSYDAELGKVVNTDSAVAYSIQEKAWRSIRPLPESRRGMAACALDENWILLAGGFGRMKDGEAEAFSAELYLYSIVGDFYQRLDPLPYAMMMPGLLKQGDALYLLGGEDRMRHRSNRVFRSRWKNWVHSMPAPGSLNP